MITATDVESHRGTPDAGFRLAETSYFPFTIEKDGISGSLYFVFRPNLGVVMNDVTICDRISHTWEGQAYVDNQQHLPCPKSLSDFALPNGASLKVLAAPRDYQLDYIGIDDTEVHFEFKGIMAPQDINDSSQDPLTRRARQQPAAMDAWDGAFAGHFEMTARVTGELVLRGKRFPIDCLGTMDHSWGVRAERDNTNAVWFQGHFGDDLVVHALAALDPRKTDAIGPLWHGYVLKNGAVRGLVSGNGRTRRKGPFVDSVEVVLTDEDGDTYEMSGAAVNWMPWAPYPSVTYYQSLTRWVLNGRTGYGPYQEVVSRAFASRHHLYD